MVDLKSNKFCDDTDLVTKLDTKRNAHIKWAFATSLDGMDVGCAGKMVMRLNLLQTYNTF